MFHFTDTISFDFDRSTSPDMDNIVSWVTWDRDLKRRTEFGQENIDVARNLFDPSGHTCTVLPAKRRDIEAIERDVRITLKISSESRR